MSLLGLVGKGMRSGIRRATDLSVKYSKVGRIRFEIVAVKKEIEEQLIELGGRVYESACKMRESSVLLDKEMQKNIERLKELEEELKELKIRLEHVKKIQKMSRSI